MTGKNRNTIFSMFIFVVLTPVVSISGMAATQIVDKKITGIHVYVNSASFEYTPQQQNGEGCTGVGANKTVSIDWTTNENYKAMYSAALAAFTAGKTVSFGVTGCVPGFGGDIPKVYRVDVED